ncbi:fibroblast growth factor receptor-like [Patiria miniata]|uniref:Protein kinase domain-containing protein n=1 Tax=Patiria miniata TaxID=46514 RepID=A0A914AZJ6_PATMI|nr:fibroblast growth factor receptor-like [Patiria miniata]
MASNTIVFVLVILGLFLSQCHCPWVRTGNPGGHKSEGSCELYLTRNVSALVEGIPVQFACSVGRYCKRDGRIRVFLNGSPTDEPISDASTSNMSFVPDRNYSGLLLECMYLDGGLQSLVKSITLDVTFPPKRVAVSSSSMNCNRTCRAELIPWQTYEFKCRSVDSNPPCTFNWTLEDPDGRAPAITPENATWVVSKTLDAGWDATSSVRLEALPNYHRRIMRFPPKRVAVSSSSMNCNRTCRAELIPWQTYEFKCRSVDSYPPCTFNWTLEDPDGRAPAITPENATWVVSKTLDAGWDATSSVRLEALPNYHRRIMRCSVLHPNNLTVFREISQVLLVNTEVVVVVSTAGSPGIATILIVGCSLELLAALCILAYAIIINYVCARKTEKRGTTPPEPDQSSAVQGECDLPVDEIDDISLAEDHAQKVRSFKPDRITVLHKLGEGAFCVIYKGIADGITQEGRQDTVAVKMLKAWVPGSSEVINFMKELNICRTLEEHPYVIRTLGCCLEQEPYCLIFEYAPNGNLANFLKEKKREWRDKSHIAPISSDQIIKFACQIASGMHYLSSMKIIHRDLAAHNILLGEDLMCKVSDFGFSRDIIAKEFYQMSSSGAVPLRWMALESIVDNIYTSKSDVWSYGILLWEMVTMGTHPYPGIEVEDIIDALKNGRRLPQPSHCGDKLYTVMKECWHPTPTSRPKFDSILNDVVSMSNDPSKYLQMSKFTEEY